MRNAADVQKIRMFLEDNKISQKDFAEKCGISISALQKVLGKWTDYTLGALFKVSKGMGVRVSEIVLNVSVDELICDDKKQ